MFSWEERKVIGYFASKQIRQELAKRDKEPDWHNVIRSYHIHDDSIKKEHINDGEITNQHISDEGIAIDRIAGLGEHLTVINQQILKGGESLWKEVGDGGVYYDGGNVGIGNSDPSHILHIGDGELVDTPSYKPVLLIQNNKWNGSYTMVDIISGRGGKSMLQFGDSDNHRSGVLDYSNGADAFSFHADSTPIMMSSPVFGKPILTF